MITAMRYELKPSKVVYGVYVYVHINRIETIVSKTETNSHMAGVFDFILRVSFFRVTLALMFGSSIEFNNFNLKPISIQLILIALRALETMPCDDEEENPHKIGKTKHPPITFSFARTSYAPTWTFLFLFSSSSFSFPSFFSLSLSLLF